MRTNVTTQQQGIHGDGDVLLTVPEVAEFLKWSVGTTYHRLGDMPGVVHLGRRCVRVWKSALISWAEAQTRTQLTHRKGGKKQ